MINSSKNAKQHANYLHHSTGRGPQRLADQPPQGPYASRTGALGGDRYGSGLVPGGLLFGTDGYGWGTRWVNLLVLCGALMVVFAVVQTVHNRTRARR